jgi:hypothetical protein
VVYQPPTAPVAAAEPVELPQAVYDLAEGVVKVKQLLITDDNGNVRAKIETGANGMASVSLLDNNDKERAALYLDGSGNPVLYFSDSSGNVKTQYYVDPAGNATLSYVDGSDNVVIIPKDKKTVTAPARPETRTIVVTQPRPTTPTVTPKEASATVWVLKNFGKYHRRNCDRIKDKPKVSMSLVDAKKAGYKPCPECRPMQ